LDIPVRVCELGSIARTRDPVQLMRYAPRLVRGVVFLCRLIRRERIRIVHCNQNICILYAALASWLAGARCVWHVRNPVSRFGAIGRFVFRRVHRVLCVAEWLRRPFLSAFPDAADRVLTLYDGIDWEGTVPGSSDAEGTAAVPVSRTVGMVGRITPWKGQDVFVEAVAPLLREDPALRAVIVGDCVEGTDAEYRAARAFKRGVIDRVAALGLSDRIVLAGFRPDARRLVGSLDVFVLPSREEPFGLVLLEAMAAGVPVVATNTGGPPEILRHEREGLLVEPGDPGAMTGAVARLLSDGDLARRLAGAARQRLRDAFTLDTTVRRLEDLYERLT
jgi:glycosyltransferase involved in cell wall biosynthesis